MEEVIYSTIVDKGRCFHLKESITVQVDFVSEYWIYEYPDLGISCYSMKRKRAEEMFQEDFSACWDYISNTPDEDLTQDAVELKRKILSLVDRIEDL